MPGSHPFCCDCEAWHCICGLCSFFIHLIPCCRYTGPNDKTYSEEDFRGSLRLALLQSLLCTPFVPCFLSVETESPGQGVGARLASGIGFLIYGFLLAILPYALNGSPILRVALPLYGGLIFLVGLFYVLTALRMRSHFKAEAQSKPVAITSGKTGEKLIEATGKTAAEGHTDVGPPPAYQEV